MLMPISFNTLLQANGWRYPLVGGTRERHFDGINLEPHKLLENAQTPTTTAPALFAGVRVHAVLACNGWMSTSPSSLTLA